MKFLLFFAVGVAAFVGLIDLCIAVAGTRWSMLVAIVLVLLAVQASKVRA